MEPELDELELEEFDELLVFELNHISYFRCKLNADVTIKLQRYIIDNRIKDEDLEDEAVVRAMLLASMNRVTITPELLNNFKETVLSFGLDTWKVAELYHLNLAILLVACVEYVLYPDRDDEEYNMLHDLPKENIPNEDQLEDAKKFFYCEKFLEEDGYLNNIRSYLRYNIYIGPDEIKYMKNSSIKMMDDRRDLEQFGFLRCAERHSNYRNLQ
ncbi:uncharacterized protein LOC111693374 isoform X2 [Trichogramma pretiosum]|uniref:uncharacterized protein LOC111693374 isoform X2 n=1 Tax=Trichogramma pretiosum TaxID=7493 RepID=UPI000C718ACA|nr:uncharacterized protein LOC111693374 isoform X2 [Trichogramma pretiosum]